MFQHVGADPALVIPVRQTSVDQSKQLALVCRRLWMLVAWTPDIEQDFAITISAVLGKVR
jgi:hypothetical protein